MAKKKWKDLKSSLPVERREAIDRTVQEELEKLPLYKLRKACNLTQQQVATQLGVQQAAVSKIERQTDMHIGTVRRFIEAMGGTLELVATFPEGKVTIDHLATQKKRKPTSKTARPVVKNKSLPA